MHSHHPIHVFPLIFGASVPLDPRISTQQQQIAHHAPVSPTATFPPLGSPPDEKFRGYGPTMAGRAVLIELYAPKGATREVRERTWQAHAKSVKIEELGLAAQSLERAGINWRQARGYSDILAQAKLLPKGSVN